MKNGHFEVGDMVRIGGGGCLNLILIITKEEM